MKKLSLIALALVSTAALAQSYFPNQPPSGATGEGRFFTQEVVGKVISVNRPITRRVVVGQNCTQVQQYQQPQRHDNSSINSGTIIGGIAGAIIGNQVGGGQGKTAATAIGAVTGAMVGNNMNQQQNQNQGYAYGNSQQCEPVWDEQIVGYSYTVQYRSIQMDGVMARVPRIGEEVPVIVRSVYYAGNGNGTVPN